MTSDTAPVKLLLVDDEATLREPLAAYLSRQGFIVSEAHNAAAARSTLSSNTHAAIASTSPLRPRVLPPCSRMLRRN